MGCNNCGGLPHRKTPTLVQSPGMGDVMPSSDALGRLFGGGHALALDANLVAFGLRHAVVCGHGDVLHVLDHRDARVGRGALVLVSAHADLVEHAPEVVLFHAAVLEGLVHAELVVAVVLDGLRQVLDAFGRGLARVDADDAGDVLVALVGDVLVVLRPAGRLLRDGTVVADHVRQQDGVGATVGDVAQGADGVGHAVAHAEERGAESNDNIRKHFYDLFLFNILSADKSVIFSSNPDVVPA